MTIDYSVYLFILFYLFISLFVIYLFIRKPHICKYINKYIHTHIHIDIHIMNQHKHALAILIGRERGGTGGRDREGGKIYGKIRIIFKQCV